jgi:hypothetical protein
MATFKFQLLKALYDISVILTVPSFLRMVEVGCGSDVARKKQPMTMTGQQAPAIEHA